MREKKKVYSLKDLCNILDLSLPSIYKLMREDKTFPIIRINSKFVAPIDSFDEWFRNKIN